VAVVSRRASVLRVGWDHDPLVREQIVSVVADRECDAAAAMRAREVPVAVIAEPDNRAFSDALLDHCRAVDATHLYLLFGRLLSGQLLDVYRDRIVNVHPALLPAFRGLHGFEDTIASGTRYLGVTLHFIDEAMDEGSIIIQSVTPIDPIAGEATLRERQFVQMCQGFVQVAHWLDEERLTVADGEVVVSGARFDDVQFVPALDAPEARSFTLPASRDEPRTSAG
jgi:phosphoribosylglycinamide formyltransferase-1